MISEWTQLKRRLYNQYQLSLPRQVSSQGTVGVDHKHGHLITLGITHITLYGKKKHGLTDVQQIQWFPGDAGLFTILTDSKVTLWDTESLSNVYSFPVADLIDHQWSEMGLIAASSREIMLLDPQSGAGTHTLKGHNGGTLGLKWSPAREFILASCGGDGWIKLWDIRKSYEPLAQFQHGQGSCNGIVFSSDGISLFSTGEDERLHCWNVFNQRPRDVTFAPHFKNRGQKKKMVVLESNLEPTLLFYPTQNQILAYNYMTGLLEYRLKGHLGNVHDICQGSLSLYSCGKEDGTLHWSKSLLPIMNEADDWSD